MAYVQAQFQSGIVHTLYNVQQPLGLGFQNIFQNKLHTGIFFQKVLPEQNGLLHIPDRIIDPGIIATMDDDLFRTIPFGEINCLPITLCSQCPGFFVDGTGKQFVIRRMEGAAGNALQFLFHNTIHPGKLFIHIPGSAVFRNFQTKAILTGQRSRIGSNGGKINILFFHRFPLAFRN